MYNVFSIVDKLKSKKLQLKYVIIIIVLVTLLWFSYGTFFQKDSLVYSEDKNLKPLVSIEEIYAQNKLVKLQLVGVIGTKNNINVMSELSGRIESVHFNKGDFVKKGEVIYSLEINDKQINLDKAKALLKQRQIEYMSSDSLNKMGYKSESSFAGSLAELKVAESDVRRAEIDLDNCNIRAPFDGVLDTINAKKGMLINQSTPLARIIECKEYIVKTKIPEKNISKLEAQEAEITLPAFDHTLKGIVSGVSMKSDDNTRSYEVEINIPELEGKCMNIVGMTADVSLDIYQTKSYRIPSYAFSLSDDGLIGVKILSDNNTVEFQVADVLEEDSEGYFWAKLPKNIVGKIHIITQGHTYVKIGEKIQVNSESSKADKVI